MRVQRCNLATPSAVFESADCNVTAIASCAPRNVGHQQVTDAYLLGLALHRKGKLVTLDSSIASLLPVKNPARDSITLI
jgi:predicted nucleic acid-binding protein